MGRKATCSCGSCKKCKRRVAMRKYLETHPEQRQAARDRSNAERRDPARAEILRARDRARRPRRTTWYGQGSADPETEAHNQVAKAIKEGRLVPEPCLFCGAEKVQAHHHDYTKVLEVTWLCRRHHLLAHDRHSKLSVGQRSQVIHRRREGRTIPSLAQEFGVSETTISRTLGTRKRSY